ncbi:MAG: anti-sigma factor [Planctomycetota bacterium]
MTKRCEQLDAYLEGELQREALTAFEDHLSACEACQHEVELARQLEEELVGAWQQVVVSSELRDSILAAAKPSPAHATETKSASYDRRKSVGVVAALMATAAALTFLIVAPQWENGRSSEEVVNQSSPLDVPVAVERGAEQVPAVTFQATAQSESNIIVPQVSNQQFTIVQVYPVLNTTTLNTDPEEAEDERVD